MMIEEKNEGRKAEILLAARELFIKRGYDQTSVNDILKVVKIAKGTFYYYYLSKAEVLEAIILEIVDEGATRAKSILNDKSIPLVNRIMMAIMAQAPKFDGADEIKDTMHNVENTKLERLYLREMLKRLIPMLEESIVEGIREGMFHTDYPTESLESILLLGHMMFNSDVFSWENEEYPRKVEAFLSHVEKLLGTKKGELNLFLQLFD